MERKLDALADVLSHPDKYAIFAEQAAAQLHERLQVIKSCEAKWKEMDTLHTCSEQLRQCWWTFDDSSRSLKIVLPLCALPCAIPTLDLDDDKSRLRQLSANIQKLMELTKVINYPVQTDS